MCRQQCPAPGRHVTTVIRALSTTCLRAHLRKTNLRTLFQGSEMKRKYQYTRHKLEKMFPGDFSDFLTKSGHLRHYQNYSPGRSLRASADALFFVAGF